MVDLKALNTETSVQFLEELFERKPARPLNDIERSVVLYGAGNLGKLASEFLQHVGVKIEYVLDRAAVPDMKMNGVFPVYSPDEIDKGSARTILVSLVNVPFSEIYNDLKSRGWEKIIPFYDYALCFKSQHPLNNGWYAGSLSQEDRAQMRLVLNAFQDMQSRAAYLQFIAWRLIREDWCFDDAAVTPDDRYFIEPVKNCLGDDEDFIDIGAYDGSVLSTFLKMTKGKISSAQLFEPDSNNLNNLLNTIGKLPSHLSSKINMHPVAVSEHSAPALFSHGFGMTSRLSEIEANPTKTIRLDDMDLKASFIKIHVEGGEYAALKGALQTLKKHRPILTVTTYHNRDGLWKIPEILIANLKDYNFYFRLHSWCGTGAVIYAIPNERLGK